MLLVFKRKDAKHDHRLVSIMKVYHNHCMPIHLRLGSVYRTPTLDKFVMVFIVICLFDIVSEKVLPIMFL